MRFYILNDLVSPANGQRLTMENARVVERDGPDVARCMEWCGLRNVAAASVPEADCRRCSRMWVEEGALSDGTSKFPIVDGIPRFVSEGAAQLDGDTQESFGYEWEHFDRMLSDYDTEVENYFGVVPAETLNDAVVMDAGCGMGRWARYMASKPVRRLYAVDFSRAIDRTARTLADYPNAHCVQADVTRLPFRSAAMDFSYCLGVLHHHEISQHRLRAARFERGDEMQDANHFLGIPKPTQ